MTEDPFEHWTKLINSRGDAGIFARGNKEKKIVERSVLDDFLLSLSNEFGLVLGNPNLREEEPPDANVTWQSKELGVELTELIDGKLLSDLQQSSKRNEGLNIHAGEGFRRAQWTKDRFVHEVVSRIRNKHDKFKQDEKFCQVLVIYTAEHWLMPESVEEWVDHIGGLEQISFQEIFLLMEYSPGFRNYSPLFWIKRGNTFKATPSE